MSFSENICDDVSSTHISWRDSEQEVENKSVDEVRYMNKWESASWDGHAVSTSP